MKGGNKEILMGVKVRAGRLRIGSPLYVVLNEHKNKGKIISTKSEREFELGKVTSIQKNNEDKEIADLHDEVCIRIENPNELSYDRHFDYKDEVISRLTRESIDILKIDVQGYELQVLKGAISSLKSIEIIIVEVSFLEIYQNCPLANKLIQFLDNLNFQIFDIVDFKYRPLDSNLFQVDMFFIKKDSNIIKNKNYNL